MANVLVAYVTHSGSTREVAEFLGQELRSLGHRVDIRPAREVADLAAYDAVVAGGLLYRFGWHRDMVRFLDTHAEALSARRVALFLTGLRVIHSPYSEQGSPLVLIDPNMQTITPASSQTGLLASMATLERYLKAAMPAIVRINPFALACFAGKYDPDLLDAPNRTVMALVTRISGARPGDYRNWDAIRDWVRGLDLGMAHGSGSKA
jgi:menaquinone-dependent protoporphyrinogen oxidase